MISTSLAGRNVRGILLTAIVAASISQAASASTSDYRYDSLGRLTVACNTTPADGERTDYVLDRADNRSNYANTRTDFTLTRNTGVDSSDHRFTLRLRSDGLLRLIQNSNGQELWLPRDGSNNPITAPADSANFQSDGNLVLYTSTSSIWHSASFGNYCAQLYVQNDGNVVVRSLDGETKWQTNTGGH